MPFQLTRPAQVNIAGEASRDVFAVFPHVLAKVFNTIRHRIVELPFAVLAVCIVSDTRHGRMELAIPPFREEVAFHSCFVHLVGLVAAEPIFPALFCSQVIECRRCSYRCSTVDSDGGALASSSCGGRCGSCN
jgi:hypothetical protein